MSLEIHPVVCPLSFSNSAGVVAQCAGRQCGFYDKAADCCAIVTIANFCHDVPETVVQ